MLLLRRVARAAPLRHARTAAAPDPSNWAPLAAAAALLLASQTKSEEMEETNALKLWFGRFVSVRGLVESRIGDCGWEQTL